MMKFSYTILAALLLSAGLVSARRGGRGGGSGGRGEEAVEALSGALRDVLGNTCNATNPCLENEVCMTTPYGNKCRRVESLPCMEDSDCPDTGSCYTVEASVGMCGGCSTDEDCTGGMMCYTRDRWMHGKCVECLSHGDCDASSFCGKESTCEAKLADGEDCKYDDQCANGSCVRGAGGGRRGRGWQSPRGTCGVSEEAADVDITDIRSG